MGAGLEYQVVEVVGFAVILLLVAANHCEQLLPDVLVRLRLLTRVLVLGVYPTSASASDPL